MNDIICSNDEHKHKIAMIAITDKALELNKPCWIAALMDAHINDRKAKYIIVKTFQKTSEVN